jgi:hypothetical protein
MRSVEATRTNADRIGPVRASGSDHAMGNRRRPATALEEP